jgi:transposase, IS5 family
VSLWEAVLPDEVLPRSWRGSTRRSRSGVLPSAPWRRRRSCWGQRRRALRRARRSAAERKAAGTSDPTAGRRRGRLCRAVDDLTELLAATRRIAEQTRQRLSGITLDGATRRVSLHDADGRPIAKVRLGRPVEFGFRAEFGYKAQVVDNDEGVVLDHTVKRGNPTDGPQFALAVGRVIARTGRRPRTVTADRGYGDVAVAVAVAVENDLHELGVRTVVIPRKGRPGKTRQALEHRRAFRRTVKWRIGREARISTPRTAVRLGPHPLRRLDGARIGTGHGVLAHNLVKIAAMTG